MNINHKYQLNPLDSILESLFSPLIRKEAFASNGNSVHNYSQNPIVKVSEDESFLRLDILVPGWSRNELELEYLDGLLWLKGKPQKDASQKNPSYEEKLDIKLEVPKEWNLTKSSAKLTNGILTVKVPQKVIAKRKILRIG